MSMSGSAAASGGAVAVDRANSSAAFTTAGGFDFLMNAAQPSSTTHISV